jgi:hypothetical protein
MAGDAGLQILQFPASAAAVTGQVTTTTGVKGEIPVFETMDVVEFGFLCTVATDADTLAVTLRRRPTPGSASGQTVVAVLTGPAATIIAAGTILRTFTFIQSGVSSHRVEKGDGLAIDVTDATGAGSGFFYIKAMPAGESTSQTGDLASTT